MTDKPAPGPTAPAQTPAQTLAQTPAPSPAVPAPLSPAPPGGPPAWVVVGASSAIAVAFARRVAAAGCSVVLCGRDRDDLDIRAADLRLRYGVPAEVVRFDATDPASHGDVIGRLRAVVSGPVSLFVAAGSMPEQAALERDPPGVLATLEANLLGVVSLLTRMAPWLEDQRGGAVVVLGSVAGDRGRRKNYIYGAAKAGLHAYLQGLRARLFPAGVAVVTVKPGFVDTAMTFGQPGLFLVASPDALAAGCLRAVEKGRDVVYLPWFWRWIMLIIRLIPERIFKRTNI